MVCLWVLALVDLVVCVLCSSLVGCFAYGDWFTDCELLYRIGLLVVWWFVIVLCLLMLIRFALLRWVLCYWFGVGVIVC